MGHAGRRTSLCPGWRRAPPEREGQVGHPETQSGPAALPRTPASSDGALGMFPICLPRKGVRWPLQTESGQAGLVSWGRPTASRLTPGAIRWRLAGSGAGSQITQTFLCPVSSKLPAAPRMERSRDPPSVLLTSHPQLQAVEPSHWPGPSLPPPPPWLLLVLFLLLETYPFMQQNVTSSRSPSWCPQAAVVFVLSQPHSRPPIHSEDHPTTCLPYYLTRTPRLLSPSSGFSAHHMPHPWASRPPFPSQRPPPLILIYLGSTGPSLLAQDSGSVLGGRS